MVQTSLQNMFENYLTSKPLFSNKNTLTANHKPNELPHREDQTVLLGKILMPALRNQPVSNVFIYGKTGTGKTIATQHVCAELQAAAEKGGSPLDIIYTNLKLKKVADTEYRLLSHLAKFFGVSMPDTGLPTEVVYQRFFDTIDSKPRRIVLVLDEIDRLVQKAGDDVLYNLIRINTELKNAQLSIVGITNDVKLLENLDPRIRSSLGEEEIVFPPYNAMQLQDILSKRAKSAFNPGTIEEAVIPKCAAYAAKEHGDARRALDLLRVAGEIAERNNETKVLPTHVDDAVGKLDSDNVLEVIKAQPIQSKTLLYTILLLKQNTKELPTGMVYEAYKQICEKQGQKPLTQRRVSDLIAELDTLGILNSQVVSRGRYGRTREITLAINSSIVDKVFSIIKPEMAY